MAIDALGNSPLEFKGRVRYSPKLSASPCGDFDGVDDEVVVPDDNTLDFTTGLTIYLDVRRNAINKDAFMISKHTENTSGYEVQYTSANYIRFILHLGSPDNAKVLQSTSQVLDTDYHEIVCTFNSGTMKIYIDGVEDASTTTVNTSIPTNTIDLYVGRRDTGIGASDVCMRQCALFPSAYLPTAIDFTNSNIYLTFSETDGTTIYDVSGNSNHGTLNNATLASYWGQTQDDFHYNICHGFRDSSGVQIPALLDGSGAADGNPITNPSGYWHNGAATSLRFEKAPELIQADIAEGNDVLFDSLSNYDANDLDYATLSNAIGDGDQYFIDETNSIRKINFLIYSQPLIGSDLNNVKRFVGII